MGSIKLVPCPRLVLGSRPLLRPFKWGSVWCFISRGIKTARTCVFYYIKGDFFWTFNFDFQYVMRDTAMKLGLQTGTGLHLCPAGPWHFTSLGINAHVCRNPRQHNFYSTGVTHRFFWTLMQSQRTSPGILGVKPSSNFDLPIA